MTRAAIAKNCTRFCQRSAPEVDEAQIRLVNERGGRQRVIDPLGTQSPARDPAQILVHHRDQAAIRSPITVAPRREQRRHIIFVP